MVCDRGASGRFRGFVVSDGVLDIVAYDVGMCSESSVFLGMCAMRGV